jgi:hypothetical protein
MTDYVHPGWIISRSDGDRHYITGTQLIKLYGLNPQTTMIMGPDTFMNHYLDNLEDRHFYPRSDGEYRLAPT